MRLLPALHVLWRFYDDKVLPLHHVAPLPLLPITLPSFDWVLLGSMDPCGILACWLLLIEAAAGMLGNGS